MVALEEILEPAVMLDLMAILLNILINVFILFLILDLVVMLVVVLAELVEHKQVFFLVLGLAVEGVREDVMTDQRGLIDHIQVLDSHPTIVEFQVELVEIQAEVVADHQQHGLFRQLLKHQAQETQEAPVVAVEVVAEIQCQEVEHLEVEVAVEAMLETQETQETLDLQHQIQAHLIAYQLFRDRRIQ